MPRGHVTVPLPRLRVARRERADLEPGMSLKQADEALTDRSSGAEHGHFSLAHRTSLADVRGAPVRSGGDRDEPAASLVDPAAQAQARRGEIGERFIVAQHVAAIEADPPHAAVAGVVFHRLEQERAFAANIRDADGDAGELSLSRLSRSEERRV